MLLNQQLTPISSRCRVESNCGRDASRAASREAGLVASSGMLLASGRTSIERARIPRLITKSAVPSCGWLYWDFCIDEGVSNYGHSSAMSIAPRENQLRGSSVPVE